MLNFLFRNNPGRRVPEEWQDLPLAEARRGGGPGQLHINMALQDSANRFDCGVLLRVSMPLAGADGQARRAMAERLKAAVLREVQGAGRGIVAAVLTRGDSVAVLSYTTSLREGEKARRALEKAFAGSGLTVRQENDFYWQVYRELLPL